MSSLKHIFSVLFSIIFFVCILALSVLATAEASLKSPENLNNAAVQTGYAKRAVEYINKTFTDSLGGFADKGIINVPGDIDEQMKTNIGDLFDGKVPKVKTDFIKGDVDRALPELPAEAKTSIAVSLSGAYSQLIGLSLLSTFIAAIDKATASFEYIYISLAVFAGLSLLAIILFCAKSRRAFGGYIFIPILAVGFITFVGWLVALPMFSSIDSLSGALGGDAVAAIKQAPMVGDLALRYVNIVLEPIRNLGMIFLVVGAAMLIVLCKKDKKTAASERRRVRRTA